MAILLLTLFVIMMLVSPAKDRSRDSDGSRSQQERSWREEWKGDRVRHWAGAENTISQPTVSELNQALPVQPAVSEVSAPPTAARLPAPTLRCYDYFEFPNEGAFHVKTCSGPSTSTSNAKSGKPTRIFLQWFPVEGVSSYKVYCNQGPSVSTAQGAHLKSWPVAGSSYYFESEPLDGNSCWSTVVTAVNASGEESLPSATYTTCGV